MYLNYLQSKIKDVENSESDYDNDDSDDDPPTTPSSSVKRSKRRRRKYQIIRNNTLFSLNLYCNILWLCDSDVFYIF